MLKLENCAKILQVGLNPILLSQTIKIFQINEEITDYRNVWNFLSPLSQKQEKASHSLPHLLPSKYYFSLFQLVGAGGTPDTLSPLVIFEHHNSHGCQWDFFPRHSAYSRLSTTLVMLIIKGLPLGCHRSRGKTLPSYN